jgi:hypothetical protein
MCSLLLKDKALEQAAFLRVMDREPELALNVHQLSSLFYDAPAAELSFGRYPATDTRGGRP